MSCNRTTFNIKAPKISYVELELILMNGGSVTTSLIINRSSRSSKSFQTTTFVRLFVCLAFKDPRAYHEHKFVIQEVLEKLNERQTRKRGEVSRHKNINSFHE